ncbi:MAG: hypothetical protein ACREQL_13110 [Candidatus Binatia bacterium]
MGVGAVFGLAARSKYDGAFEAGNCDRGHEGLRCRRPERDRGCELEGDALHEHVRRGRRSRCRQHHHLPEHESTTTLEGREAAEQEGRSDHARARHDVPAADGLGQGRTRRGDAADSATVDAANAGPCDLAKPFGDPIIIPGFANTGSVKFTRDELTAFIADVVDGGTNESLEGHADLLHENVDRRDIGQRVPANDHGQHDRAASRPSEHREKVPFADPRGQPYGFS